MRTSIPTFLLAALIGSCAPLTAAPPETAKHVSLLKIVLDCKSYDQRAVTVIGAVELEPERQQICPARDFLEADPLNCLWLAWTADELKKVRGKITRGTYVVLDATVHCASQGHGGLFAGSLRDIELVIDDKSGQVLWQRGAFD